MTKTDLVNAIAEKSGLTKADAKKALDAAIETVAETLVKGDKISLPGFGSMTVVEKGAYTAMHPTKRTPIEIPARKNVKFKAGSDLLDKLN